MALSGLSTRVLGRVASAAPSSMILSRARRLSSSSPFGPFGAWTTAPPRPFSSASRRSSARRSTSAVEPTNPSDPRFAEPLKGDTSTNPGGAAPVRPKGPNNTIALGLFLATGAALFYYFASEKKKVEEKKRAELATKGVGRVMVGGPFELVDVKSGQPFTEKDLLGKFNLIYFGFTNCPDICPEELDKMSSVVDTLNAEFGTDSVRPIFVTVDPARDSPAAVSKYLQDFHSSMLGLTGTYDQVKAMCKTYRVYFSTPPNIKPGEDYLVDHSIFFYLMSPNGYFVDAFGKIFTKDEVAAKCQTYFREWRAGKRLGEEDD